MPGAQLAWRASRTLSPYSTRMMTAGSMRGKSTVAGWVAAAALVSRLLALRRRSASAAEGMPLMPIGHAARQRRQRGVALRQQRADGAQVDGGADCVTNSSGCADRSMAICATSASQPSSTTERAKSINSAQPPDSGSAARCDLPAAPRCALATPHEHGSPDYVRSDGTTPFRPFFYSAIPPRRWCKIDRQCRSMNYRRQMMLVKRSVRRST